MVSIIGVIAVIKHMYVHCFHNNNSFLYTIPCKSIISVVFICCHDNKILVSAN